MRQATHLKEGVGYAVKEVENESLDDEENLEALETEVCSVPPPQAVVLPPPSLCRLRSFGCGVSQLGTWS